MPETPKRRPTIPARSTASTEAHRYAEDVVEGRVIAGPIVRDACRRHLRDLESARDRGLHFDEAKASRAIRFFPDVLRLNGGQFEGVPFELHPSQAFIVGSLFGWCRDDGTRRFRMAYIEQGKGNGKALALDTPIPTPTGWTTMGELRTGSEVLGADGKPCRVLVAHPVSTDRDCYRIAFDDGEQIVASAEHLWRTEMRMSGSRIKGAATKGIPLKDRGAWRNGLRTTADIARTLRYANGRYQSANHSIALAEAIDLPDAVLPIEPYGLGVWLGDGDSDCARITIGALDAEATVGALTAAGWTVGERKRGKRYRIEGLQKKLRAAGLLLNKHIPAEYMRASKAQRLSLLQGLMDTDGCISTKGQCEFTQVKRGMAEQVLELARSLGLKATMSEGVAKIDGRTIGPKYRVQFDPGPDLPVFRIPRKLERQAARHSRRRLSADRKIVACDLIESVPVRCITVDSPDSMFLAGRAMVPTHNSPLLGGVGLYGLTADGESRAEVYSAATKKDQAMILFRDAVAMVDQSPILSRALVKSGRGEKAYNLYHPKSGSFFRPISSDDGQSGPRPHIGLIDELHEHRSANVINMMTAGRKWRRQPLVAAITNSGHDRTSVCWEYHEMARQVCSGATQDDTFFAYVCALDDGEDPFEDEACWIKANPLLGTVIQRQYLRDEVTNARGLPSKESTVRRLNFCQWTESANPLIPLELWDQCKREFTLEAFRGRDCYLGIDLSATQDLTALVLACDLGGVVHWWPMFWLPKEGLVAKAKKDHVPYDVWERAGWLRTTPGKAIDKDFVVADMAKLIDRHGIKLAEAPYDRARINELRAAIARVGVNWPLVEFGQGFISMGPAVDSLETSVLAGKLAHNGSPCLRWNVANATAVEDPAGNRKLDKSKSTGRIDGAVAGAMAHHRAVQAVKPAEPRIRW